MGVGEDIRTLKEAIMVGRRHGVRGKHWWRSYERNNVTTRIEKKISGKPPPRPLQVMRKGRCVKVVF